MNLQIKEEMTYQSVFEKLKEDLPQYRVELKKNPLAKFEFVQVRKGPFVASWVRLFPKKEQTMLIRGIPDFWARLLLGGLLAVLFFGGAQKQVEEEVAESLKKNFGVEKK